MQLLFVWGLCVRNSVTEVVVTVWSVHVSLKTTIVSMSSTNTGFVLFALLPVVVEASVLLIDKHVSLLNAIQLQIQYRRALRASNLLQGRKLTGLHLISLWILLPFSQPISHSSPSRNGSSRPRSRLQSAPSGHASHASPTLYPLFGSIMYCSPVSQAAHCCLSASKEPSCD
eukprot:268581-Rhodomonas_salina.2